MIRFSKEQVLMLHKQLVEETGGDYGLRDEALLESALMSPFQTFDNVDLFLTIPEKAARLGYGLIKNHPFTDGNKRIGTHVMLLFLHFNGIKISYSQQELIDIILGVASNESSYKNLYEWIIKHQQPLGLKHFVR